MTIFIDFPCNGGAKIGEDQTYEDVLEDHYATCRICLNEEEQDHVDSLHAHRTAGRNRRPMWAVLPILRRSAARQG